ncbi:hypothetical protein BIV25_16415 [Streptomyces sp. MUSC 14]|uniref:hypothetical protein n=1 Tax=Streptomyces sp. MUSC 14 TaxID=1354889 RepID=UPI0008F5C387|nr:hypothetical protein [Streptomyces sp. MUSC 14]OIJ96917.1 hypothetical protein BIV25_16415 [Streptomyces sp. MUSC 14]
MSGDADAMRPAHVVEFCALLGGGPKAAGSDGSGRSHAALAALPSAGHYGILAQPTLTAAIVPSCPQDLSPRSATRPR